MRQVIVPIHVRRWVEACQSALNVNRSVTAKLLTLVKSVSNSPSWPELWVRREAGMRPQPVGIRILFDGSRCGPQRFAPCQPALALTKCGFSGIGRSTPSQRATPKHLRNLDLESPRCRGTNTFRPHQLTV